jgi:hypothetical protein
MASEMCHSAGLELAKKLVASGVVQTTGFTYGETILKILFFSSRTPSNLLKPISSLAPRGVSSMSVMSI